MRPQIFLSGPIGCGKSTLIQNALGAKVSRGGGFLTRRVTENGVLCGFELLSPCSGEAPRRFLSFTEQGPVFDGGAFVYAASLLKRAGESPFALCDETGGMELLIPEFAQALTELIKSGVPCVGVVKCTEAARALVSRMGISAEYMEKYRELIELIKASSTCLLHETRGRYDGETPGLLARWTEEYAGE